MIDGGFRLSDGHALAKAIVATGKRLTTIYISQSDPDYYFGLAPVLEAFPDAVVVAAPETVMAIAANVDKSWPSGGRSSRTMARSSVKIWCLPSPGGACTHARWPSH